MKRTSPRRFQASATLHVNPIRCDGVGVCSHFAPSLIVVDSWGYPIINGEDLTGDHLKQARAAVAACPVSALFLETSQT
jgi:ferredoxin